MGDVGEGEPGEGHVCLMCQQPSPEERNYSEKRPVIPNMLSVSLKMPHGLHTETLQHNLACGKATDDAPDNRQVTGGPQRGASRKPGCPCTGKPEAEQLEDDKKSLSCVFWQLSCFPGKKKLTFQGCVYHHPGVFPLYRLKTPLAFSQGNSQEQNQAVVPAVRHRLRSPLELQTFALLFSCKGKCWVR